MSSGRSVERGCVAGKASVLAFAAAAAITLLVVLVAAKPAHAADFSVDRSDDPSLATTPTADDCTAAVNDCSLRGAITRSNAATSTDDTVNFNIPDGPAPGLEVKTISPRSLLPTITDTATIDGYTQPGAAPNSAITNANSAVLKVELSGASAPSNAFGLAVSGADAAGTSIKGLVINRFAEQGVFVSDSAPNVTLEGNFIGTDPTGTIDRGNGSDGVTLLSSGNVVGGAENAAQNVISGNKRNGVAIKQSEAAGNTISNNHIGTDKNAEEDLGNTESGVFVEFAPDNTIGGNGANGAGQDEGAERGEGNIISGNNDHGVEILNIGSSGTRVLGNYIGLNRNGNGVVGNTQDGVRVSSAPQTEIGGTGEGEGNTISDNGLHGVEIAGTSSTFNKVQGNHIGTNFNGGSAFGNAGDGVRIGNSSSTTIGGTTEEARNVISGNTKNGVFISGTNSGNSNRIQGNYIGTNASGTGALGNGEVGARIETPSNFVGGTASGAGNVISGNGGVGVSILATGVSNAQNNRIEGNLIGPDANGDLSVGGNFHGVFVSGSPGNTVGGPLGTTPSGPCTGACNDISGNRNNGVMILGAAATGNRVLQNSIFANGSPNGLGIALGNDGVTANDKKDPDGGPNKLQNFPVIDSATTTRIEGRLNSRPNRLYLIQLYSSPQPNFPTLFGEGKTFLGERFVETNDRGKATFTFTAPFAAGQIMTATATDSVGNTSEFSRGVVVE